MKYALQINEDNLDLIERLNDGVRPKVENDETWFVFDPDESSNVPNEIKHEDDLYDEEGNRLDTELKFLIG